MVSPNSNFLMDSPRISAEAILSSTQTAIFWKDKRRRFLGANQAFLDYFGIPDESLLLGQTDEEMGFHTEPASYQKDEERILREGISTHRVHGTYMVRGEVRDIVASKRPLYQDGQIVGLVGSFEDATKEYRQEAEIIRLNGHLRKEISEKKLLLQIINNVPTGLCVCTIQNGLPQEVTINRYMAHRIGRSDQERRMSGWEDLLACVHPSDKRRCQEDFLRFLRQEQKLESRYRVHTHGNEEYIWVHIEGNLVLQPNGSGLAYFAYTDVTELVNTAAALRESRHMYEVAVKSARLVLWEYDISAHRLTFSQDELTQSYRARFGIPAVLENVPESLRPYFEEAEMQNILRIYKMLEGGHDVHADVWYKAVSGQEARCERTTYTVVLDETGCPIKAYGLGQDITTEKKLNERYEREMEYLRETSDQRLIFKCRCSLTNDMILEYTALSEHAHPSQFGCSYDETWAKITELVHLQTDRAALREFLDRNNLIRRYQQGEADQHIQYSRQSSKNTLIWVSLVTHTYLSPDSGNVECFMYAYDITEKMLEQQILAKLTDLDYDELGLIYASNGACRIYRLDDALNAPSFTKTMDFNNSLKARMTSIPLEVQDSVYKAMCLETVIARLQTETAYTYPSPMIQPDGSVRQKLFQMTWLDENRDMIFFCMSDITRQYESEHRQISELAKAKMDADRANQAKSNFLSSMSHDLRTPLNGILGFTDIAIRETDPAKKQEYLAKIQSSGNLLLALVNDTLELSRIESGKMTLEPEIANSREIMSTVITSLRPSAELKQIHLEANEDSFPSFSILVDKLKLQKILLNLLSNSIKYTPAGGTIRMSVEILDPPVDGCNRRFIVEDNGIGMSEEFQTRIYEPFSQEHRPESVNVVGTGLGLSIVKRIVDLMGGRIAVQSKINVGTRFTLELPIQRTENDSAVKPTEPACTVSLSGKKMLLCEDNRLNTEIALILLKEQGISVDCAVDGREGLTRFRDSLPSYYDAILMDIRMPIMDGHTATRSIRALSRPDAKTVPIIAMTADAFEEDIQNAKDAGMNDYITKPIEPGKLTSTLQAHIK